MNLNGLLLGSLIVTVVITFSGTISTYYKMRGIENRISAINEVNPVISESAIIALIDQRIAHRERQKVQQKFASLEADYTVAPERVPDNRLVYGSLDARITLQEFADTECPYCRKIHSNIKQVVDHSQNVINWEFRHFPLGNHNPAAAVQSQAIECINEDYGNRTAWVAINQFMESTQGNGRGLGDLDDFVRSFGLNGSLLNNCLASNNHKVKINQDYAMARDLGIKSTPTIRIIDQETGRTTLINGFRTPEQILQAIGSLIH